MCMKMGCEEKQVFPYVAPMYSATLPKTLGGLVMGSVMRLAASISSEGTNDGRVFTGGWPMAAAFYVYKNGL